MRPFQNADGGVNLSVREYDIAYDMAVNVGQVVVLASGLVSPAAVAQTEPILGIAAETHSGKGDAINPRSTGERIQVYDGPDIISQCAVPTVRVASGSATTLVPVGADIASGFADDAFNGGYVRLASKAEGSTNTDALGTVRRITDYTATTKTFTLKSGGVPFAGDVYEVYPPLGFTKGNLDTTREKLVLTATAEMALKVVGHDRDLGLLSMLAVSHFLGTEN